GPNADLESVRLVAAELESFERGMDAQYVWRPEITRQTNMTDGVVIRTFSETEAGQRLARAVKAHVVSMHLRRDPPADEVKWLVRAEEYRRALITTGAVHRLPPELPRHSTFVHQHERGGTREVAEEARNYSAKEPGADVVQLRLFA
ncbi:MAG TPA: hypothetical protein VKB09_04060, partial [Thermomicrobiales bacterium]|nr:hypothetical protein [Thermomicrobiales bacterium]